MVWLQTVPVEKVCRSTEELSAIGKISVMGLSGDSIPVLEKND